MIIVTIITTIVCLHDRNWWSSFMYIRLRLVPFLLFWRMSLACSRVTSHLATTRSFSGVITWRRRSSYIRLR